MVSKGVSDSFYIDPAVETGSKGDLEPWAPLLQRGLGLRLELAFFRLLLRY